MKIMKIKANNCTKKTNEHSDDSIRRFDLQSTKPKPYDTNNISKPTDKKNKTK